MAGSKRDSDQHNQQVAETTDRRVPSSPFDSPSLPPNLPPAFGETAVVLGPGRATTNYLLLSANLRHPTGPSHVTPVRPHAHQRVARTDPKESRKVALRLISRGRPRCGSVRIGSREHSVSGTDGPWEFALAIHRPGGRPPAPRARWRMPIRWRSPSASHASRGNLGCVGTRCSDHFNP
jgi:hypothetical protein